LVSCLLLIWLDFMIGLYDGVNLGFFCVWINLVSLDSHKEWHNSARLVSF